MDSGTILIWVGVVSLLALISSVVTLLAISRFASEAELRTQVRQVTIDLHDLFDTVEKWTRRDRVRRLREGREESGLPPVAMGNGSGVATAQADKTSYKAALRARLREHQRT